MGFCKTNSNTMVKSNLLTYCFGVLLLALTSGQPVSSESCVKITAGVTTDQMTFYIFAGSQYTYYNVMAVMTGQAARVGSVSEFAGIPANTTIDAGYMEPNSADRMKLFSGNDVYVVDVTNKKVVEQTTVAAMFSDDERTSLTGGVQAAVDMGDYVYIFSGCDVIKTNFVDTPEHFGLAAMFLPCDVDAVMPIPARDSGTVLITKGAQTYGLVLDAQTSYGMDCADKLSFFTGLPFHLCGCSTEEENVVAA